MSAFERYNYIDAATHAANMANPACERCAFWEKLTTSISGICRREPPRSGATWPITQRHDWCGEFRERPTEAILSTDAESR